MHDTRATFSFRLAREDHHASRKFLWELLPLHHVVVFIIIFAKLISNVNYAFA